MSARLVDSLLDRPLGLGTAQNDPTQGEEDLGVPLVVGGGVLLLEPLGQLVALVQDVLHRSRHDHHLRTVPRSHGMNDAWSRRSLDHTDLKENGRRVGSDDQREALIKVVHPDRVGIGVQDVPVAHSVLTGAFRDDRLTAHHSKLTCRDRVTQGACARLRKHRGSAVEIRVSRRCSSILGHCSEPTWTGCPSLRVTQSFLSTSVKCPLWPSPPNGISAGQRHFSATTDDRQSRLGFAMYYEM